MPSTISWIDFDETDRKRMLEVVKMFRDRDTRDELGIGSIRDAFANYFFPGTSTIHTRARYFFFIPWVYKILESKNVPSHRIAVRARELEIRLINALKRSGEDDGVIGKDIDDKLKILPSQIYWSALAAYKIRFFNGTREQYHRSLDSFYKRLRSSRGREDADEYIDRIANWDPELPEPPEDFHEITSFKLTSEEADYLKHKIIFLHRESLLAQFLIDETLGVSDFPWEEPIVKKLSPDLQRELTHSRNFSESIHGAAILYNYMLAQKRGVTDGVHKYRNMLDSWKAEILRRKQELKEWHTILWQSKAILFGRIPYMTKSFINQWFSIVFDKERIEEIEKNDDARNLIFHRECRLKGNRARLENQRALELWGGASGTARLNYRWNNAWIIMNDIINQKMHEHSNQ
jgi:hypothetical protein